MCSLEGLGRSPNLPRSARDASHIDIWRGFAARSLSYSIYANLNTFVYVSDKGAVRMKCIDSTCSKVDTILCSELSNMTNRLLQLDFIHGITFANNIVETHAIY